MNKKPLVSVLMTAFNREKYIEAAINSVLVSSFSDFELIVVDDHSQDQTVEIVENLKKIDTRIKLHVNEQNLGDYYNRNCAATLANGKYLKYLDSDDLIYPHSLEIFVQYMESNPDIAIGLSSGFMQHQQPFPIILDPQQALRFHFFDHAFLDRGPSGSIIRKDIFEKLGGFSGKRIIGDTEFWLKVACQYPVMILPPALVYWRQHDEQEYRIGIASNLYLELYQKVITETLRESNCPLFESEKAIILTHVRMQSARSVLSLLLKKRKWNRAFEISKKLDIGFKDIYNALFNYKSKLSHEVK